MGFAVIRCEILIFRNKSFQANYFTSLKVLWFFVNYFGMDSWSGYFFIGTLDILMIYLNAPILVSWVTFWVAANWPIKMFMLKVRWFGNVFLLSSILPKNKWKNSTLLLHNMVHTSSPIVFNCFLGEMKTPKRHFEIEWPLNSKQIVPNVIYGWPPL